MSSRVLTRSRLIAQGDLNSQTSLNEMKKENTPLMKIEGRKSQPLSGILVDSTNIRNSSSTESMKISSTPKSRFQQGQDVVKRLTKEQYLCKCPRCTGPVASPLPSPSISSQESLNEIPCDPDEEDKREKMPEIPRKGENLLWVKLEGLTISMPNPKHKKRCERRKKKKGHDILPPSLSPLSNIECLLSPLPSSNVPTTVDAEPLNANLTPIREMNLDLEGKETSMDNSALLTPEGDSGINNLSQLDSSSSIIMSFLESPNSSLVRSPLSPRTPPDQIIMNKSQKDSSLRRKVLCHNALCISYRDSEENDSPLNSSLHFCNMRSSNEEKENGILNHENANNSPESGKEEVSLPSMNESELKMEEKINSSKMSRNESEASSCLSVFRGDVTKNSLKNYLPSPPDVKSTLSMSDWIPRNQSIEEAHEVSYDIDVKKSLFAKESDSFEVSSLPNTPIGPSNDEEFVVECPKCAFRFCSKCQNSSEDKSKPHRCRLIDSWLMSSTDDSLISLNSNASASFSASSSTKSKKKGKNKNLQRLK